MKQITIIRIKQFLYAFLLSVPIRRSIICFPINKNQELVEEKRSSRNKWDDIHSNANVVTANTPNTVTRTQNQTEGDVAAPQWSMLHLAFYILGGTHTKVSRVSSLRLSAKNQLTRSYHYWNLQNNMSLSLEAFSEFKFFKFLANSDQFKYFCNRWSYSETRDYWLQEHH